MSKELTVQERQKAIENVEGLQKTYGLATLQAVGHLQRAVMIAEGIQKLRVGIGPLMPIIYPLMNNPLGFDTDKNPAKSGKAETYSAEVVVDCVVEAMLRGLRLSGNEFNIITGKCYTTQNGYRRLVQELPGITDLDTSMSPPFQQGGHTCVKARATWKLNGQLMGLKGPNSEPFAIFAIRVNSNQGIDATLGKAERRMYKAIYSLCTGTQFTEPNVDEDIPILPGPENETLKDQAAALADQLANQKANALTADQKATLDRLKAKVGNNDFAAAMMKRGTATASTLTKQQADECIEELAALADDGGEPPV